MYGLDTVVATIVATIVFAILAPIVGCLLAGLDRKVSARMQGRVGPPLLQPYYDVRKLMGKERASVNGSESVYVTCAILFTFIAGGVFFAGGNFLLSVFLVTLSALFFIIAAYSTRSPYAEIGAHRETLQVMSYEPMVLLMAVGFFMAIGTFDTAGVFTAELPAICSVWGVFLGFLFVLSMSHHAHQEIVRGVTTEMSGPTLAKVEIMHWAENVLFLSWTAIFFVWANPASIALAVVVGIVAYFLEVFIDNNFARVKWQAMLKSAWAVALVLGGINIAVLAFI